MSTLSSADAPATETPALPGDVVRERVVTVMREHLGDAVVDTMVKPGDDVWVRVRADAWQRAGEVLRDVLGCSHFCFLSAIDWMPSPYGKGEDDPTAPPPERDDTIRQGYTGGETRFQMLARVTNPYAHYGVNLKCDLGDDLSVATWIPVYAGANWHEREAHEMFGIVFAGHPDLRNLYLPTGFEGYPLRKDFPLLARMVKPWPGIVDVEPLPASDDVSGEGAADSGEGAADTNMSDGGEGS